MYFRFVAAMFDLSVTLTWEIIRTNPTVSSDHENMGIAVVILLLSRIEAEIYVISYLLPVNGRHLWFPTDPYVGNYFD